MHGFRRKCEEILRAISRRIGSAIKDLQSRKLDGILERILSVTYAKILELDLYEKISWEHF